ncbi:MAG: alanine dehydrogenase [Methanomassiliicoccales archaeon]|nr:MAG: alanine dehydrogenase [Methanomassiliicoccales archaeon]
MLNREKRTSTLLLTARQIEGLLQMKEVISAVESAFRYKGLGKVDMPPKSYLTFTEHNGDLRTMPSYIPDLGVAAVKVVNSHPDNFKRHNMRTVMATLILVDPETGAPISYMDATLLTGMRTGAASAVASKYLAIRDPKVLGVIGAGNQAKTQIEALMTYYGGFEEIRVNDHFSEKARELASHFRRVYGDEDLGDIRAVPSPEDCVRGADIVVTATPSRRPIVKDEWVSEGVHFNCIGADAPGKQEMDPAILRRAMVVVDDWEQASHSGEINIPLANGQISKDHIHAEIGQIVAGLSPGRENRRQVTVFCSTGLAVQDAVTAKLIYEKAVERGIGTSIQILP